MRTVAAGLLAALLASQAAAQNAAGAPTVSGLWVVGEALTASTGGITDPEGVSSAAFAHQWVRVAADGAETDIGGATSSTHTLAPADQGGRVKVRVSFSDDAGNPESRTSAAYPASGSVLPEPCGLEAWTTLGEELWSATMVVGSGTGSQVGSYGFVRGTDADATFGELSVTDFTFDGRLRSVQSLFVLTPQHVLLSLLSPGDSDSITFQFEPSSDDFEMATDKLVLRACNRLVSLLGASVISSDGLTGTTVLNAGVADWAMRSTRKVRLHKDEEAPKVRSATALGRVVTVAFSEPLYEENSPIATPSDYFRVQVNGSQAAIEGADIVGNKLKLTLAAPLGGGDAVEVDYTSTGSGVREVLSDLVRNGVGIRNIDDHEVRVAVPPALRSQVLAADGVTLTLTFNEDLDGASVPPAGAFTVRVGGAARPLAPVNPVAVAGRAVVLRLAEPAGAGERVTVSYDQPAAAGRP